MAERRKLTKKERKEIYDKMQGRCAYCGIMLNIEDMQVDHVIPLHRGGTNDMSNLVPACRGCNHYKSTLTLEEFRKMIIAISDRLMLHGSAAYKLALRIGLIKVDECVRNNFCFYFEKVNADAVKAMVKEVKSK